MQVTVEGLVPGVWKAVRNRHKSGGVCAEREQVPGSILSLSPQNQKHEQKENAHG